MVPNGPQYYNFGISRNDIVQNLMTFYKERGRLTKKRPHYTPDSFHEVRECPKCKSTHFSIERPLNLKYNYYRTYGYRSKHVVWRIRCGNRRCSTPFGVILKPQYWDSAS